MDTRRQILLTIKEQAQLLREPPVDLGTAPAVHRWSPQQWWESFTFLFVNPHASSAGHHQHQDDLLFFVSHKAAGATAGSPHVFVRRKGKQLPADLQLTGKDFGNVDWAQTVLLNLVLHSQYQLTVVACGPEALPFVAEGRTWSPGMISVSRPVYACTTVTAVNLDSSRAKASNPQPCFPDICFAVDNFDNAFEDLVLEEESRCYCVVLHAMLDMHYTTAGSSADLTDVAAHLSSTHSAQTQPPGTTSTTDKQQQQQQQPQPQQQHQHSQQQQQQQQPSHTDAQQHPASNNGHQHTSQHNSSSNGNGSSGAQHAAAPVQDTDAPVAVPPRHHSSTDESGSGAWQIGTHKRTLFAGYVSFQQIADFMEGSSSSSRSGRSLLDSWIKGPPKGPQKDKVVMTGPGGMGRCEVAVTKTEATAASAAGSHGSSVSSSAQSIMQQQQQQQQQSPPTTSTGQQQGQGGLLQRGLQRARHVASGVQQALDVLQSEMQPGGPAAGACHMLCALMTLRLPVQYLAQELLAAV